MTNWKPCWQTKEALLEHFKRTQKLGIDNRADINLLEQIDLPDLEGQYGYTTKWTGVDKRQLLSQKEFRDESGTFVFEDEKILYEYDDGIITKLGA